MTEELREFDDSIGRCIHCGELIFKSDNDFVLPDPGIIEGKLRLAHRDCEQEYMARCSQI